jgi:hypothetical protein
MDYPVQLEGFEGQNIVVQGAGLFSGPRLLVNGEPAPKGSGRGQMVLKRNDGQELVAAFRPMFLDVPRLSVGDKVINLVQPLKWYEWAWNALPLLLILGGGLIPYVLGFAALAINLNIFRSQQGTLAKYGLTALVSIAAGAIFFIIALIIGIMYYN